MAELIRYYFDEHMPLAVAYGLRNRGIDVETASELGRCGLIDEEQFRYANAEGSVTVTHDEDYVVLAAAFLAVRETFAGVAYCHPNKRLGDIGWLIRQLIWLHQQLYAVDMQNHVQYL